LPDSLPAIGPVAGAHGVWLCCGHQHIGFSTAPGSGEVLAALIDNSAPVIGTPAFDPARFTI